MPACLPVLPSLTFSKDQDLPLLIVVLNNNKYEVMRRTHLNWYPSGVAASEQLFYGVHINGPDYSSLASFVGGHGARIDQPAALNDALTRALAVVQGGRTAILNVMLDEKSRSDGRRRPDGSLTLMLAAWMTLHTVPCLP
jgi:acetolactate synthase-1/2/3 large subunit